MRYGFLLAAVLWAGATEAQVSQTLPPQEAAIAAAPAPYTTETVRFDNTTGGVTLSGTFSKPAGKGPFPTVLLLAGSGPNDRDECVPGLGGHRKFLIIADALGRAGIAVLRYDKRGVGQSTGDFAAASLSDFAGDARAALRYLRSRPDVDGARIGLLGDSEGGYLAPMLAAQNPDIHVMVLVSTPALPFDQGSLVQAAAIARSEGRSDAEIAAQAALYGQVFAVVKASATAEQARATLSAMSQSVVASGRMTQAQADAGIAGVTSPLAFELMHYDPRPNLQKVRIPVLVISGSLDVQAPAADHLPAMRDALSGDTDATILELPGINHQLQPATTGAPSEYAVIPQTVDPGVLKIICDWLSAHMSEMR